MRAAADVPTPSWWQRASKTQAAAAAILFSFLIFGLLFGFDVISTSYSGFHIPMMVIDGGIAVLCGSLMLKIIQDSQARHRAVLQRLETIAELNHHIRNALDQIELSAHTTHDSEVIQRINEAVARIEWALREVLPKEPGEKRVA
jgi:hypothetical protein